ncbi:type I-A CRISPR-associated protein Cas5 [Thermococcus siculi]|uniref:Type I-A CRISPR-associated protein Cas5 n=1 Tax=Thermococcus siculi TaxID=72803 RepID=A0A2Z2MN03_9EURY|nr:type I-A CRISPR-associated protein Cas5a [Thermococcus siculi]ASJ08821.1 type I-A CRISPR-associated protein Cas5 [Thermococcus siculi]
MNVLLVRLRFPFFSVARRSYQVRTSLLLPPPSSLKGALAKGLILLNPEKYASDSLDKAASKAVGEIESKLVNVKAVSVAPISPLVKNAFLLKRLRNLESGSKAEKGDAMRREYTFTRELLVAYVFKDLTREEKERYLKAAMLIDIVGDTESIATPLWASFVEPEEKIAPLAFSAPYSEISSLLFPNIRAKGKIKVYTERAWVSPDYSRAIQAKRKRGKGKKGPEEETFYLPIEERRHKRTVYYTRTVYSPNVGKALTIDGEVLGIWIPKNSSES